MAGSQYRHAVASGRACVTTSQRFEGNPTTSSLQTVYRPTTAASPVMQRTERKEPTPLTDQQIRSLAQTLCGEEYNPKKANALLLLMDDIQRHADAGETSEVITASIITKGIAFSKLDMVMDDHIESLRNT
ncbi:MAG TPA: hypothetical protein VE135_05260 [Pyrinomonadaceae bacterium]|nr:hypothetical protein [Pyrinomonadaceae bacterium]